MCSNLYKCSNLEKDFWGITDMKIIVLIKEIIDENSVDIETDAYLPKDVDSDDIIMNVNDKHAIESALEVKESKDNVIVHAMCVGSENALKILREAIAMGCDEASRIDINDLDFLLTPFSKVKIIEKAIKQHNPDLIFTGMYSVDLGQAQIPSLLASVLDLPQSTYVNKLEIEGEYVITERYIEGGMITLKIKYPCVLSIASTANEPRYTSVKRIMLAKRTKIPVISLDDLGVDGESLKNVGGLEIVEISKPDVDELETFKVEEEDLEAGVEKLVSKLKEDGIDLSAFKN
jgi:electron transfer flavoprotein beta subunit